MASTLTDNTALLQLSLGRTQRIPYNFDSDNCLKSENYHHSDNHPILKRDATPPILRQ
jgi:hypothetical protein